MKSSIDTAYRRLTFTHLVLFRVIEILPWNDDDLSRCTRLVKRFLPSGYFHLTNVIFNTMYLGYGLRMLLNHRLDVDYVCEVVIVQGVCLRYLLLYLQRWDLLELTQTCRELWITFVRFEEVESVKAFERKASFLRNFFIANLTLNLTFYILTAQFLRIPAAEANGTDTRILPYKFYVDVQDEPWYTLVTVLQMIVAFNISVVILGIETVGPFLIMMTCGYFRIVQNRLTSMACNDKSVDKLSFEKVLICIKFHQETLQFCEKMNKFTRSIFMVQLICTLYNMSLIGIKLLENDNEKMKFVPVLILNLMQFFTCQWISEHLINESEAITDAAYDATLTHPHFDARANRMLYLMILRAQEPVQLTAACIVRLSLESFKNLIVNAFSFFMMLRNFAA